ncbi:MAG: hypothetical protein HY913_08965 [Desulfomonile tiedjei]|nr:hypothetical protein [Desulfomonile tiedjei]
MAEVKEDKQRRTQVQKMVSLKEDGYYSNCTMVEGTPFDISILFGKIRPRTDEKGQAGLVEVYERQVYLSHLQARALHDALSRSLGSVSAQRAVVPADSAKKETTQ